ncbi:hypothetical protein FHS61_001892 [Altererythrobacter atlanticus]|uniref:Neutral ceramidase n=1 Tax=Croceibacterium atlanticum TaxID=1267766 RepID=A0A0F7KPC1_9SPHN|nr:neutral/alkaline non-lysosomal ceramidase N-terminal domain-containing protein [Croceibacterium atlanticum]AKH41404.1 Neutral ceramidase precursor [Croceibacterium atlanticum]MBB5732866.1 hypothetical protein [Croceibacterium atlanticum]
MLELLTAIVARSGLRQAALLVLAALLLPAGFAAPALAGEDTGQLLVGAARIDVTPGEDEMPQNMTGVLDPLHVRAIVVGNDIEKAAMVTVDAGMLPTDAWRRLGERAEAELGIPRENVMLTATHTHSAPFVRSGDFEERIFQSMAEAAASMQPARMAFGTGISHINVNRNIIDPETRRWWEGPNYEGPSDQTVAVLRFETLSGEPIAVYYNYAVHPVITGTLDMISADIPGAASNYIEESLGGDAVAVWSSGASGDQNPIFFQQTYDLREIRIADYARRGEDISNAMPPGGQGLDRSNPKVRLLLDQQKRINSALGLMLAEEVLHVMREGLQRPEERVTIAGALKTATCPGRRRLDEGRAGYAGTYEDADPIDLQLSLLKIGNVVIGGVDAEIFTLIAQRFKDESPYRNTMMATLTNGAARSGYIPNDAAFNQHTFEVVSSRLKPGCAETAIVEGLLDLIDRAGGE